MHTYMQTHTKLKCNTNFKGLRGNILRHRIKREEVGRTEEQGRWGRDEWKNSRILCCTE